MLECENALMIESIAPEYLHKISQGGFLRAALNNHAVPTLQSTNSLC